jgi:universal stress protein F
LLVCEVIAAYVGLRREYERWQMNNILVGLDGSQRSADVLETAIGLARQSGNKLILFRSFGVPPEMPAAVWKLEEGSLIQNLREHTQTYLNECARSVPKELLAEVRVEVGVPWQAVCAAAKATHAALVVIGSHGYGAVDRLLGTTAAKIVNHAECSVLVVRPLPKPGEQR